MNHQHVTPDEVYERLIRDASDIRRKRSLEVLHEICKLLDGRFSNDFSYRSIVTLGKDRGLLVPSEKTILNSTGSHYRELIHAWRLTSVKDSPKARSVHRTWIESIPDPALRMSVTLLAEELRAMKAKESRKSQHSTAPVIIGNMSGQILSPQLRLNDAELSALKSAIDPITLRNMGMSIGTRGEVLDVAGRNIQKPGFRDAIEKILSLQTR